MPIEIQCDQCQQSYKVGDNLAGKKVKCRNCGAPITVQQKIEGGVQDEGGEGSWAAAAKAGGGRTQADNDETCPNCSAAVTAGARLCLACGFDLVTGRQARTQIEAESAIGGIGDVPEDGVPKKRKAWTRKPGNSSLEQLDQVIKLAITALLLAGIIVGVVHLNQVPGGLTGAAIVPMLIMIGLLAVVIAPLATYAVNTLLKHFKILPREDTYTRIAVVVVLPFAMSLIAGWPGGNFGWLVNLAWVAAGGLLIYLLRGEAIEFTAGVLMGGAVIGIGAVLIGLLSGPINSLTGPMDPTLLPGSPWTTLATGKPAPPPDDTVVTTKPQTPATTQGVAVVVVPDTGPSTTQGGTAVAVVNPPNATQVAVNTTMGGGGGDTRPGPTTTVAATQRVVAVATKKISSPFFANIMTEEPGLKGVSEFMVAAPPISPATATPYFLAIKNGETSATVERWSVSPLEKKGEMTFPLLPRLPNTYALSSKGDLLATLVVFPQMKLEVSNFDARAAPKKVITLPPSPTVPPKAVPTLVGFMDQMRVCIRWDLDGETWLQMLNVQTNQYKAYPAPQADPDMTHMVLSPNGHLLAIMGARSKDPTAKEPGIMLLNLDATTPAAFRQKLIDPTPLAYLPVRLAFSPDGSEIALYAVVADVPVVMSFRVSTGDAVSNSEPISALPKDGSAAHALQYVGPKLWLVAGDQLVDATTGRKLAKLNVLEDTGVVDQSLAGPSSMLFLVQSSATEKSVVVVRVEETKLPSK